IGRIGVGYNAVRRDLASGFIGLAGVGSNEGGTGVNAEFTVPVADRFALRFSAHYADGEEHPITGIAAGGRVLLGSAPAPAPTVGRGTHSAERPRAAWPGSAWTCRPAIPGTRACS